jgi:hypothetical protein
MRLPFDAFDASFSARNTGVPAPMSRSGESKAFRAASAQTPAKEKIFLHSYIRVYGEACE